MKKKWIPIAAVVLALALAAVIAAFAWKRGSQTSGLGEPSLELTHRILALGPRPPGSDALDQVRALLGNELEKGGWSVRLQEFERDTPIGKVRFVNLRARFSIDKSDPWARPVEGILCAHIDSKLVTDHEFLGADDAASACAAVVRIGTRLSSTNPARAAALELVLFDGEEAFSEDMTIMDGLYGSRYYANSWRGKSPMPSFGILLDMIGHKDLAIRIPSDSPENLARIMFDAAKSEDADRHFGTFPGPIMDDHLPLNLVGIPTIDIIGDFGNKSWWHTPGDNFAILSARSLDISTSVVLRMLGSLLPD